MKQSILRLFTCLILGVVFCTTAWGQSGPTLGTHFNLTYSDGSFNISNTNFNSSAKSIKVFFDFGEGNIDWIAIAYDRWNAQNQDKRFLGQDNLSQRYHTIIVTNSDIISEMSSTSGISVSYGNTTRTVNVIVTNYNTADGAANDKSEASGIDPNADENDPVTSSMTLEEKIAEEMQLTNVPTIYLTVPDALNEDGTRKDINSVIFKDRQKNEALYHQATITVVDENGGLEPFTDQVLIKARGNSTADLHNGKLPYRLKFAKEITDEAGNVIANCQKHDMVGNGYTARNWTLIANQKDESMMRNALTYHVGKAVGMPFCPGYKFVDVVINGEYRGTYQVSDHVEVGKNRIYINEDTGWYIESAPSQMCEEPKVYAGGLFMTIKNPEPEGAELESLKTEVSSYFTNINYYMGVWSTPCSDEEFRDPINGWRKYFDEESLVKFYLGINLTGDYDGFMTVKMYREADGKMKFGPLWDKDLAYGNWGADDGIKLCEEQQVNSNLFSDYMQRIMTDPVFVKKVHDKLHDVLGDNNQLRTSLHNNIDDIKKVISKTYDLNKTEAWRMGQNLETSSQTLKDYITLRVEKLAERIDEKYIALGGDDIVIPEIPDMPEDPEDTPVGDLGALVDLGDGKYSYTGSASTFKEGTEITITTSENTSLSNYITEGNVWNTNKTITLTASDVTTLAANSYTFFMNATGGEVKAVNVKVPSSSAGAEFNKEYSISSETNEFLVPASYFNANATSVKIIFKNNTNTYSNGWNGRFAFNGTPNANDAGQIPWTLTQTYTYTLEDATKIQSAAQLGMGVAVQPSAMTVTVINYGTSQETTIPTYALTLNATEGGTVSGAGTYAEGTTVLIKAIPNDGYKFVKWSDDNTYASRSVTLKEAITLTATFAAEGSTDEDPFNEQGTRKQLTDLPTIYLNAENINGEWLQAAVEVFDKDNKLYQGATWKKEGVSKKGNINVSVQYQGSGGNDSKNSYRLKFNDKINLMSATGLYKQWVLLSNDDDPTMLNNALAKELGDAIGMPWTPGYQFVDLYVNDKYMGTYQLTDRVKAEDGRSLVTGGNKDNDWQLRFNDDGEIAEDGTSNYITSNDVNIIYRNPDPKDITAEALETLKSDLGAYFNSFFAETAANTYANIPDNVDKQQLINWYIAQEILSVYKGFSSIEAYRSITEGAADNLLHFGPLWDSEKGFGNTGLAPAINMSDLNTTGSHKGLMIEYSAFPKMNKIFQYLWTQDWFKSGVKTKWDAIKTSLPTTLSATITTLKETIAASQALNAQKWSNSLGNYDSYEDALAATNTYITNRFAYLEKKFTELAGAAHVHSYTAYIDNGDGTHSRKCPTDNEVEEGSEIHTLIVNANGKAACSVCNLEIAEVSGTDGEKVYMLNAETSKVQYITKTSGFTPTANTLYPINEKPEEGTVFNNVYWTIDGVNYADNIIVTDGTAWLGDVKVSAKNATYSRTMSASSVWGTVCLPFKTKSTDDITLYELSSSTADLEGNGNMLFVEATSTGGLTPLVYKKNNASATSVSFKCSPQDDGYVTVKAAKKMSVNNTGTSTATNWQLIGNVQDTQTLTTTADAIPALYGISSNKFWHATGTLNVTPFRAYFTYTPADGSSLAKSFSIGVTADEEATNITSVNSRKPLAIFLDKGSLSLASEKSTMVRIYSISGTIITNVSVGAGECKTINLSSGIYIVNGTKVTVK